MNSELRARLQATADEIVAMLEKKDDDYGSSWKSYGGFSAFFNLDRKFSRIQNIAQRERFDVFAAIHNSEDGVDAMRDLVGYALLTLSETYEPKERAVLGCRRLFNSGGGTICGDVALCSECVFEEPGPEYVDQNGGEDRG